MTTTTEDHAQPAPQGSQSDQLIRAALVHVPFDGMNHRALAAGAKDVGISPALIRVLVPDGGAGLAAAYHRQGDAALAEWMAAQPNHGSIRTRVADAIWKRLELADRELVRAGAATMALPQNSIQGGRLVWETADTIWNGLGDTSDDVSWWTRRATLASVWGAVVLYWLGDASDGRADTRAFIDRRIEEVMQIEKFKASARKVPGVSALTNLATGWIKRPHDRAGDHPGHVAHPAKGTPA